ncbi:MAG: aminotransferase class V-fold PLP-dependent enzyme [Chloroflexota bacterium]|nr:aminotransferase class V-fold PLP-dependent enzyme [Chloroflexota bacterium]
MSTPRPAIDPEPDLDTAALQALRGDFLYFNVAGSGPTFPAAQDAAERFRRWLNEVGMFSHVGYEAYNEALHETRADLAAFIGDPGGASRIALTQSATDALNLAVGGLRLPPGSLIVTTAEEHASALLPVYARQSRGDRVEVLRYGDPAEFAAMLARLRPAAVVLSLVSCKNGRVLDVAAVAAQVRDLGALVIVDAAQAVGHIPVDVRSLDVDALVLLGHKWLHGPLATGALWVRDPEAFDPPRLGWRSRIAHDLRGGYELQPDATRFETGTVDVAAFVGLRQSLAIHRGLGTRIPERLRTLRGLLLQRLEDLPFEIVSRPEDPTGIIAIVPRGAGAAGIVTRMWTDERIVVKQLAEPDQREGIRLSFWALHQERDLERLAAAFARCLAVRA